MRDKALYNSENTKNFFCMSMFVLGVIALRIFYISRTTGPFIYGDEFGYWSHAAHLTGNTWAGVMDNMGWYSFGYSFWLALTFLVSDKMVVMSRVAVLFNILMSLGIYFLAYSIVRKLSVKKDVIVCGAIALAATSFPTYIFYSYTTMTETLVALLVWLLFYELISLEKNPVWWKGVLSGFTTGYIYMVHNRTLTTVLAVCVCMIVLWIMHRIDWKIMLPFILSLVAMVLFYVLMKGYLEGMITDNQAITDVGLVVTRGKTNTYQNVFNKFIKILSPTYLFKALRSMMGQLWQCLSSTYLLIGFGVIYCIRNFKKMASEQRICAYVYPLLVFLFSVGLTAVVMRGPSARAGHVRIDTAFYGRYNECYFPLLIMMALLMLWEGEFRDILKIYLSSSVLYLCLSVGLFLWIGGIEGGYLNIVSDISIHIFHWFGEFSVWKCCLAALPCSCAIVGLCCWKRSGKIGYYGGLLLLLFLFSTTALYCMRTSIRGENDYTLQYAPMYDYLNENTQKKETVYICDGRNKAAYDLQSRLVNKIVIHTLPEKIAEVTEVAYVVMRDECMEELGITDYDVCMECQEYVVLRVNE